MPPMATTGPTDDDVENRRAQLLRWIVENYGGVRARFVEATEINQGELSGLLSKKSFGEKRARSLELQAGMPVKYLERREAKAPTNVVYAEESRSTYAHEWPFKRVTREQYARLTQEQRNHIESSILLLLPASGRGADRKSSSSR